MSVAPGIAPLAPVIAATWPPEATQAVGPFTVPTGAGGGNRVSAARLTDPEATGDQVTEADLAAVEAAQAALGQEALVMVLDHQTVLDERLASRGYGIRDATVALATPVASLAAAPPAVTCFDIWPPLAVQEEIWDQAGIGPGRRAVMHRAAGPKTTLFGRTGDRPAGTAFVAIHGPTAMLHALEVLPRARRQGLAAHMMRAAAHWADSHGAATLAVLVTRANAAAQGLYASLALQPVGHYHYRVKQTEPA